MRNVRRLTYALMASLLMATTLWSCRSVDDERLPNMPVSIDLSTLSLWNAYGVTGFGDYREFIRATGEPRNFPYTAQTATGLGGVLLISAFNPYTVEAGVPMAYDLACPVECNPNVRIRVLSDGALPYAVCPECGSKYDICERGGAATEGEALRLRLVLKRYECYATNYGGYIIAN